ncbi:hypothetical protein [Nannocystis pusilla]
MLLRAVVQGVVGLGAGERAVSIGEAAPGAGAGDEQQRGRGGEHEQGHA